MRYGENNYKDINVTLRNVHAKHHDIEGGVTCFTLVCISYCL